MKNVFALMILFSQMASAQTGVTGGLQSPMQYSVSKLTAVLSAAIAEKDLMFWEVRQVTLQDNTARVEFISDKKECIVAVYKLRLDPFGELAGSPVRDSSTACEAK
jgi:hypothetical protein